MPQRNADITAAKAIKLDIAAVYAGYASRPMRRLGPRRPRRRWHHRRLCVAETHWKAVETSRPSRSTRITSSASRLPVRDPRAGTVDASGASDALIDITSAYGKRRNWRPLPCRQSGDSDSLCSKFSGFDQAV